MEKVTIHIKELNKTFKVFPSNKVMRKVYQFQRDAAHLANPDNMKNGEEMFANAEKTLDMSEDFLKDILGLTKAQTEKIDDELDQKTTSKMAIYVSQRLMGMTDEDIAEQDGLTDPKVSTGASENGN